MGCVQTCNPKMKGMNIQINHNIRTYKKPLCELSGLDLTRSNQIQITKNTNNNKSSSNILELNNDDEESQNEEKIIVLKPMSQSTKISLWKLYEIEQVENIKKVHSYQNLHNETSMKQLIKKCLCSDHSFLIPTNTIKNKEYKTMIGLGKFDSIKEDNNNKERVNRNNIQLKSMDKNIKSDSVKITISPSCSEIITNIFVKKDQDVTINIKGKWGITQMGMVSYRGYNNKSTLNHFNLCALLYRIGTQLFSIPFKYTKYNTLTIKSPITGPLFLKMNINKELIRNNLFNLSGKLELEITNIIYLDYLLIYKYYGWNYEKLKLIYEQSKNNSLTEEEQKLLFYLNLFRLNPSSFISLFFPQKQNKIKLPLIEQLFPFTYNTNLCSFAKSKLNNKKEILDKRIKKFFSKTFLTENISEISFHSYSTYYIDIIDNVLQDDYQLFLNDFYHNKFSLLGVSIQLDSSLEKKIYSDLYYCTIVLSVEV